MESHYSSITLGEIVQTLQFFSTNKTASHPKQLGAFLGLLCTYSSNGNEIILANVRICTNLLQIAKSLIVLLESTSDRSTVALSLRLVFYLLVEGFMASRVRIGHRNANEFDLLSETLSILKKTELFNPIFQWKALGVLATLQSDDEQIKKSLSFIAKRVKETAEAFGGRSGGRSPSLLVSGMGIGDPDATNDTHTTLVAAKLQSLRQLLQDSRVRENLPLQCLDAIFAAAASPSCRVARRACALILDYAQSSQEEALVAVVIHLASDSVVAAEKGALISSNARCCSYLLQTIQTILSTSSLSAAAAEAADDGAMDDQTCMLSDDAAVDLYRSTISLLKHPR